MRFRLGCPSDLAACHELLRRDGVLVLSPVTRDAVPSLWSALLARESIASFAVFEADASDASVAPCAFAMSAFIRAPLAQEVQASPRSHLTAMLYERELAGERVLLDGEEIREANSGEGLHLAILHVVFRHPQLSHPETRALLPVAGYSFFFQHAGYRLLSIMGEVYGDETRDSMQHAGYAVLHAGEPTTSDRRPYLLGLRRDQVQPSLDPASLQLFHAAAPRFFFTPAEQRVLQRALLGASDRQIANELELSTETVRSAWESIYTRVSRVSPRLLGDELSASTRGAEKRRFLLDFLRQHLEELRPIQRPR